MPRYNGGFLGTDGLDAPDPPTAVTPTAGNTTVSVAFTAPTDTGTSAITGYVVQSNNGDGSIAAISNASYDSKSFDVAEDDLTSNLTFKPDGTKMYVVGRTNDKFYQYALSTAYDVSTASYENKSFSVASQEIQPYGIALNNDGTSMYTVGFDTDTVYQYTLSTAYDVSTASYANKSLSVGSQDTVPTANTFNADGTSLYVMGSTNNTIFQYTLSSAFDVSTGSYASKSLDFSSQDTNASGFQFNADGTKCFIVGNSSDKVHQYSLSTAYDISTASSDGISFDLSNEDSNPFGLAFSTDRTKMYVLGSDDFVYQYTTNFDALPSSSPVTVAGLTNGTSYTFKALAINAYGTSAPSDASDSITPLSPQQEAFTTAGTYSWVAPAGVSSVSVVCIGGGGGATNQTTTNSAGNGGAGGGELRYKTSVSVTAGNSYTVVVGAGGAAGASTGAVTSSAGGNSTFNSTSCVANGGSAGPNSSSGASGGSGGTGDGGGNGGTGGNGDGSTRSGGGGGAGGYSGTGGTGGTGSSSGTGQGGSDGSGGGGGGGNGGNVNTLAAAPGGGTALGGEGTSGAGAPSGQSFFTGGGVGSSQTGFTTGYGGGGGATRANPPYSYTFQGMGFGGAVRIIWSTAGATRQYPSTNTGDLP